MDPFTLATFLLGVRNFFAGLWNFISKPPGSYLLAALIVALGAWWFGQHEFSRGKAVCEAAHTAAQARAETKVAARIAPVVPRSEARTTKSQKKAQANQVRVVYIKEKAHEDPEATTACVPAGVADKLRDIQ